MISFRETVPRYQVDSHKQSPFEPRLDADDSQQPN